MAKGYPRQEGCPWWEVVSRHLVRHTTEARDQGRDATGESLLDGWPVPPRPHREQSLLLSSLGSPLTFTECVGSLGARLNPPRLLLK